MAQFEYPFPWIRQIGDVLPYIDEEHFRIKETDYGLTFINYVMMGNDVFPPLPTEEELIPKSHDDFDAYCANQDYLRAIMRRECRGIAFNADGSIASRPFHKFFNVGEREDHLIENIPFDTPHVIYDKVDGSMVRPLFLESGIRWGTKMGITDTSMLAEEFVAQNKRYDNLAIAAHARGFTPLFEFTSRRNRIVVDYGSEDQMTLLALRHLRKGEYMAEDHMVELAARYDVPVVRFWDNTEPDGLKFVESTRTADADDEGIVIAFTGTGQRTKVKRDRYVRRHKVKDDISKERNLVALVFAEEVDDILPVLNDDDRVRVLAYVERFQMVLSGLANRIAMDYEMVRGAYADKKSFALSDWAKANSEMRSIMFALWDGKQDSPLLAARSIIENATSSETKWVEMKARFGIDADWEGDTNDE